MKQAKTIFLCLLTVWAVVFLPQRTLADPNVPYGFKQEQYETTATSISFSFVGEGSEFEIGYSTSLNGTYTCFTTEDTYNTIDGLKPFTRYYVKVRAVLYETDEDEVEHKSYSAYSPVFTMATFAENALDFKVSNITTSGYELSWEKVPGADGYSVIFYDTYYLERTVMETTSNSYIRTGLKSSQYESVTVCPYIKTDLGEIGYYIDDDEICGPPCVDKSVRTAPAEVTGVKQDMNQIERKTLTVEWEDIVADSYEVAYASSINGTFKTVTTDESSYSLKGLTPGTHYYVKVRAINLDWKEQLSTYGKYSSLVEMVTLPESKVNNLKVSNRTSNSLTFSWSANGKADGYSYTLSPFEREKSGTVTGTSLTVKKLKADTEYTLTLYPYSKVNGKKYMDNDSDLISKTFWTLPGNISAPAIYDIGTTDIDLKIKADYDDTYEVAYATKKNGKYTILKSKGTNDLYTVKKLKPGKKYYFRIRRVGADSGLKGNWSEVLSAATMPSKKITGLKQTAQTKTSVTLSWNSLAGVSGYEIVYYGNKRKTIRVTKPRCELTGLKPGSSIDVDITPYVQIGKKRYQSVDDCKTIKVFTIPSKYNGDMYMLFKKGARKAEVRASGIGDSPIMQFRLTEADKKGAKARILTLKASSEDFWKVNNLVPNTWYSLEGRLGILVNGKAFYGDWSEKQYFVNDPQNLKVVQSGGKINLNWKAVPRADSYTVTVDASGLACTIDVGKTKGTTFTLTKMKNKKLDSIMKKGENYSFYVTATRKIGKKKWKSDMAVFVFTWK